MTMTQVFLTILTVSLATALTRFLPFIIFPAGKQTPKYIQYLGKVLPSAVFGLLVVYCLKNVSLFSGSHGLPEAVAIAVTVVLHLWTGVHRGRYPLLYASGPTGVLNAKAQEIITISCVFA